MKSISSFAKAMTTNDSRTANNAVTHSTSNSACLDLFFLIGASRGEDLSNLISKAFSEDFELCTRILLWSRDIRQGAGERQHLRSFLKYLEDIHQLDLARRIINVIPELGRWDDMLVVTTPELRRYVANKVDDALLNNDALCAKWMPRENSAKKHIAKWLMQYMNREPREYRIILSDVTKVVETQMCKKEWNMINYSHVPSKALLNYTRCFTRNDEKRFSEWILELKNGKSKINAGAVFPHEILQRSRTDNDLAVQMWKALPNWLNGNNSILPICDVSASMYGLPMDISIALGIYIAQRNEGPFKNMLMGFNGKPDFFTVPDLDYFSTLQSIETTIYRNFQHDMSTNLQAVFDKFLQVLQTKQCVVEDMPKTLLIISDMEFNQIDNVSNYDAIKTKYQQANYPMPNIVFWNVNGRERNVPVKLDESGTALISGYSPSIMKSVLKGVVTPEGILHQTVMIDRYNLNF